MKVLGVHTPSQDCGCQRPRAAGSRPSWAWCVVGGRARAEWLPPVVGRAAAAAARPPFRGRCNTSSAVWVTAMRGGRQAGGGQQDASRVPVWFVAPASAPSRNLVAQLNNLRKTCIVVCCTPTTPTVALDPVLRIRVRHAAVARQQSLRRSLRHGRRANIQRKLRSNVPVQWR